VRSVDANLLVGVDRRRSVFQIWGPCYQQGGWAALVDVRDDTGAFLYPPVPWELIITMLLKSQKASDNAVDRIHAHNERLKAQKTADFRRMQTEAANYAQRAIGREIAGDARWDAADVMAGWRNVSEGQGKRAPIGQRIYIPGVQP